MPLPRFTGGAVGRLSFRDLNEAFEAIDALRRETDGKISDQAGRRRIVLARVTGKQGDEYKWEEIERTSGTTFSTRVGGRTSSDGTSEYGYPLVPFGAVTLAVGDNVAIVSSYDSSGKLFYIPLSAVGGGGIVCIVMGSSQAGPGQWTYSVKEAVRGSTFWEAKQNASTLTARNGAENPVDGSNVYGVGSILVGNVLVTPVRQPIKIGTVVQVTTSSDGVYVFSIPNGYTIECA